MSKITRYFWYWYLPLCALIFGVIFAGVFYDMTNISYDPLTASANSSQSFYIYNNGTGYRLVADGHDFPFNTNLPLTLEKNVCYGITFQASFTMKTVSATIQKADPYYCQTATLQFGRSMGMH